MEPTNFVHLDFWATKSQLKHAKLTYEQCLNYLDDVRAGAAEARWSGYWSADLTFDARGLVLVTRYVYKG